MDGHPLPASLKNSAADSRRRTHCQRNISNRFPRGIGIGFFFWSSQFLIFVSSKVRWQGGEYLPRDMAEGARPKRVKTELPRRLHLDIDACIMDSGAGRAVGTGHVDRAAITIGLRCPQSVTPSSSFRCHFSQCVASSWSASKLVPGSIAERPAELVDSVVETIQYVHSEDGCAGYLCCKA